MGTGVGDLQDGFAFRSADSSYLAGPDDIYVSPTDSLFQPACTGDTVAGKSDHQRTASGILPY